MQYSINNTAVGDGEGMGNIDNQVGCKLLLTRKSGGAEPIETIKSFSSQSLCLIIVAPH